VLELLTYAGSRPSKTNLDAWINNYSLPVSTLIDPASNSSQTLTALFRREYSYVVDLGTMKIVEVYVGSTNGTGTPSTTPAIDLLAQLLGPKGG
jgi:hypothetical protein